MMMDKTCICGCQATEKHHIIFRSQMQPLEKCEMNMIYLCMECHRGTNGVHGKNGHILDKKLKKKFQEELYKRLHETCSEDDIKAVLGISYSNLRKILKNVQAYKGAYKREDVVRACMGGKLIL